MAKNSNIEWTHHTFNPWWGCEKVSPACKHCYAQTWAKRCGKGDLWKAGSERRFFTDRHWNDPLKWDQAARTSGQRQRVFCASMADVFELRDDLSETRERLWHLIERTTNLDWLLLTKRIETVSDLVPWSPKDWPENVWLGTTVENQKYADMRIPVLAKCGAKTKFLSCEPLLGKTSIKKWASSIDWIIAGGESGANSRPMHPTWLRKLRDECDQNNIPFHFKQWGNWFPIDSSSELNFKNKQIIHIDNVEMVNIGKKKAGRILDGQEWNGLPNVA
ncbi:MAG: phage Gp37/Gp68 family protein [Pseudomonadota bacterium]